jgi:hypothetical protein
MFKTNTITANWIITSILFRRNLIMLETLRYHAGWIYRLRSIYLFISLIVFILMIHFVDASVVNQKIVANLLNVFVLLAAVAAVGRSKLSFVLALSLVFPVIGFQWAGLLNNDPTYMFWSWSLGAFFYLITLIFLLRYVFSSNVMTADKLFGAASAYMLLGIFWAYLYIISQYFSKEAFTVYGTVVTEMAINDAVYFSFATLTSTGYGDIAPFSSYAKALASIEQIFGTLFVAILIARLAGIYPEKPLTDR